MGKISLSCLIGRNLKIFYNDQFDRYEGIQKLKLLKVKLKPFVLIYILLITLMLLKNIGCVLNDISELIEAQERKKANLAKVNLRVSHEIRTPLVGILGFCELLTKQQIGEREIEYVETIEFVPTI